MSSKKTYSDAWWYKLKHGGGLRDFGTGILRRQGDIDIAPIDLLNIFWEPGICDIQQSRNLFIAHRWDRDILESYLGLKEYGGYSRCGDSGKGGRRREGKPVVDWYYKKDGRLHCKFAGENVLYASECDPLYKVSRWYERRHPVVFDNLFPVGAACGLWIYRRHQKPAGIY